MKRCPICKRLRTEADKWAGCQECLELSRLIAGLTPSGVNFFAEKLQHMEANFLRRRKKKDADD